MMQVFAQSGGGVGQWLNPHLIQGLLVLIVFLFGLLGNTIKKVKEQNAKRAAELAGQRRREDVLRTGRDETGAFVGLPRAAGLPVQPSPPSSPAPGLSVGDDARRRLQQLAEQRRKELAQMVRQGQQGRPGAQPPRRDIPPIIATGPMPSPAPRSAFPNRPVSPGMPVFQPARPASEKDVRRQRDEQANKKAAQQAAAKRKAQEAERSRSQPVAPEPRIDTGLAAYAIAPQKEAAPAGAPKPTSGARVAAALDRIGGRAGAPTNAAAEWRRAIVLGELMGSPVAMRPPGDASGLSP